MMTQNGTNTYILGTGRVAVIDPGPAIESHRSAILAALLPRESISHIFVTHSHLDHSGLAAQLASRTGATIYGFGHATAGRSAEMQGLTLQMAIGGGEGVDQDFHPDVSLGDGDKVSDDTWALTAVHTPGHFGNHLCFASGGILFSGDHVMGWSTSLISPPDGDMTDYMASLRKLAMQRWDRFLPGHGAPIFDPAMRLAELVIHREQREIAILEVLAGGATDIERIARAVYPALAIKLIPAAKRNILAHLIDLHGRNQITASPFIGPNALFTRV